MNYRDYEDFIQNRMRMSHVYQPVMLMTLLEGGGKASTTAIAKAILNHDESQIEYYEKIVGNMDATDHVSDNLFIVFNLTLIVVEDCRCNCGGRSLASALEQCHEHDGL